MTTTLEQAARWVAAARGKVWPQDKSEVLEIVNAVRELIYDFSVAPWQTTLCVPVRTLCGECNSCGPFLGVSLPSFVQNALGVYSTAGRPIPVVDRWGIYPYDENTLASCAEFRFTDLGEEYPLLSDPPCGCFKLSLFPKIKTDVGKIVTLRYLDANDIERTEQIALQNLPTLTQYTIKGLARHGVSLPTGLNGAIVVKDEAGNRLSEWMPWELVPGYRRLKLEGSPCNSGCMVTVHVERRKQRLCDLADPVELDQMLVWQDGARYLYLHNKTNADQQDLANEAKFLGSFQAKIEEHGKRLRGRTHKRALSFASLTPQRSGLIRGR